MPSTEILPKTIPLPGPEFTVPVFIHSLTLCFLKLFIFLQTVTIAVKHTKFRFIYEKYILLIFLCPNDMLLFAIASLVAWFYLLISCVHFCCFWMPLILYTKFIQIFDKKNTISSP